jgi:hypothetical protein
LKEELCRRDEFPCPDLEVCAHATTSRAIIESLAGRLYAVAAQWLDFMDATIRRLRDARVLSFPRDVTQVRRTELGNILAASADWVFQTYNIELKYVLPRLLQVLPEDDPPLKRLVNEEASMNMLNMLSFWAAVWTVGGGLVILLAADQVRMRGANWLWPLVIIGGTLLWFLFKRGAVGQARGYGEALKTLVDMRRLRLLQALGLLKESGELKLSEEAELWKALYRLYAEADTEGLPAIRYEGEEP